ncbi:uncharacterized protein AB675_5188 [Cyphellophora attinorum]|uniref:Tafazzin n=1 Tax=Cyphellophora attinorum TaxID=1664694 RepID=A0A0N1HA35_9EURO|nr:uncharacterized protein AB675_5188 [Phialophora attinorum]KPI39290.1 hypothetical protein AB675_5188 [Phialophora attinorum]
MPKKRTGKALLIKPGSQAASSASSSQHDDASTRPSVNDLIRESRRLQLRDQSVHPTSLSPAASVPPELRNVLDLPTPEAPPPRPGIRRFRPSPTAQPERGSGRTRIVPGPSPPRSWLIHSRHRPRDVAIQQVMRRIDNPVELPGAFFPSQPSLLDSTLRELAQNWDYHAAYDGTYLQDVPIKLREVLLTYIAIFNDKITNNPLRILFDPRIADGNALLDGDRSGMIRSDTSEVTRLDASGFLEDGARLRQIENSLLTSVQNKPAEDDKADFVPDAWDAEDSRLPPPQPGLKFVNLKHLSLALNPATGDKTYTTASWKTLLRLCGHLSTLESLSLAHWPQPTYTSIAAQTNARIEITNSTSSAPRVSFGGTNMYSRLDNDFRESAGILRSLSQKLHSLTWLDLTGCTDWWEALYWRPPAGAAAEVDAPFVDDDTSFIATRAGSFISTRAGSSGRCNYAPDWNGAWRSITYISLRVGYTLVEEEQPDWTASEKEHLADYAWQMALQNEKQTLEKLKARQQEVTAVLRTIRRGAEGSPGKWIEFDV